MSDYQLPDFLIIPGVIIEDKTLQPLDGYVYGLVYWYTKLRLQKCIASNDQIAKMLKIKNSRSVSNSLTRLKRKGYVRVKMDNNNQRLEIVPLITFGKEEAKLIDTPSSNDEPPFIKKDTPPSSNDEHNKNSLIRTIKKNKQHEASASVVDKNVDKPKGMQSMSDIMRSKVIDVTDHKGAFYEWQDRAVRFADKLHIKPNAQWFKLFKTGDKNILEASLSLVIDSGATNPEKYFYKIYNNKKKGIKPQWQTAS